MIHIIIDNFIVIMLALVCVFTCSNPVWLIILAGTLMVMVTSTSLDDEKSKAKSLLKLIVVVAFAIVSESFIGYGVFALMDEIKKLYKVILATVTYMMVNLLIYKEYTTAQVIVGAMFLAAILAILLAIKWLLYKQEERKKEDRRILTISNIREMHEKRVNQQLVMQSYLAEKNARLLERENISRNIHNSVGHSITAAIMTLDAADMLYDVKPEDARKKMNEASGRIRGSLESIRQAVRVLDQETEGFVAGDLKAIMTNIVDEFVMDTSIEVDTIFQDLPDEVRVPHDHGEFLTGVLKELLTNGLKHGSATYYQIVLKGDNGHIQLTVTDNGNSDFTAENSIMKLQEGFGLKKIITYVKRCGGEASFVNEDGFKAVVELPIIEGKNRTAFE